jgi:opacity protein-like surface antigen
MKRFIVALVVFATFNFLQAQSFFSMRGLGEEIINTDAIMNSLGGTVIFSYQNPSYPVINENTVFEATIIGIGVYGKDANHRRFIADARPNYLKGIFSLPYEFGIGLGLSERFNQNFDVYSDTIANPGYQRHIVGYGGIYSFAISLSRSFYKHIRFGLEYNRHFGDAQERWFFETSQTTTITTDTVTTDYRGDAFKFGFCANLFSFNLGVLYEKNLPLYISSQVLSHGVLTDSISNLKFQFPPRIGFGLSFNAINKLTFYLDYFHRNSENTTIADTNWTIFKNSNKYSLGIEYKLDEKHSLRAGYRYYDWYFTDHSNSIINEQAITLGSSIPIPKFGAFNFALELINRKGSSLSEKICRLNVTLHYEEAWRIRKRRWGS